MARSQHSKKKRQWNRDIPDSVLLCRSRQFDRLPSPASLHPDIALIEQYVAGVEEARAIVASWAFAFPITGVRR